MATKKSKKVVRRPSRFEWLVSHDMFQHAVPAKKDGTFEDLDGVPSACGHVPKHSWLLGLANDYCAGCLIALDKAGIAIKTESL